MREVILDAVKKGGWKSVEAHALALVSENETLHEIVSEQASEMDRMMGPLREVLGVAK